MAYYRFTKKSSNRKTGPIPVTTTDAATCPDECPFKAGGCYAKGGPLAIVWQETTEGKHAGDLDALCAKVSALPADQLWRHNQAGDLPGFNSVIDAAGVSALVAANAGKRGFTYTHKPVTGEGKVASANRAIVAQANRDGFTINISANTAAHADELADLGIAPVVTVLPADVDGNVTKTVSTPAGRKIVVCPATYRDNVSCATCGLCQRQRDSIVGFPAHGAAKRKASAIAAS